MAACYAEGGKIRCNPIPQIPIGQLAHQNCIRRQRIVVSPSDDSGKSFGLALLWQILSGTGFTNQFFCDSWVVGFWRGRPWLAERRIGKTSLAAFSNRFWIGWVTRRGDKCVLSTCRG